MQYRDQIFEGMVVRSSDGERLGKIVQVGADSFLIEKGFFFPKQYTARFDEIAEIRDDEIYLAATRDALRSRMDADREITERADYVETRREAIGERAGYDTRAEGEQRIPLVEEELEATKRVREAGAVRVHKKVLTEEKKITVPVTREEVVVERTAVAPGTPASAGAADFTDEEIVVPVREEEVEIRKRPVVREEVRVRREARVEERQASGTVRREELDVEREGEVDVLEEHEEKIRADEERRDVYPNEPEPPGAGR